MKTYWKFLVSIIPWLIGILLSLFTMSLGYAWGNDIASLFGGEPGIWARMGKGFVWGGVIACPQWFIVRRVGVLPIRFIVASGVGFAIGYPFGQILQLTFVQLWSLHWTGYWLAVATFGLFLCVPQWWIFRRHLKHASLWILFSMTGWIFTGLLWIHGGRGGFEYGIVTGLSLVWLVHSQSQHTQVKGATPLQECSQ